MTWGWLRPVVLLPEGARRWSAPRRQVVLLHELVHVRRADWLVRLMARLACSVYWFNPLVWWAVRRLDLEQELACDEEVVACGTRASDYACHLLGIARTTTAQACRDWRLSPWQDPHNHDRSFTRVRVRHEAIVAVTIVRPRPRGEN